MPPMMIEMLLQKDAQVCQALGIVRGGREEEVRTRLATGYFSTQYRDRVFALLEMLDDGRDEGERMARGRRALDGLLKCEVAIYPFLRHPFQYGCRMPYYHEVVHRVMWMERVVYRFEVARTRTLEEDVRTMCQNAIDYSLVVNHSPLIIHAQELYARFCLGVASLPLQLSDGLTERHRIRGESFATLKAARDAANENCIRALKQARLRRLFRPGVTFRETLLEDSARPGKKRRVEPRRRARGGAHLAPPSEFAVYVGGEEEEEEEGPSGKSELERFDQQTNEEVAKRTQLMMMQKKQDHEIREREHKEAKQRYEARVAEMKRLRMQRVARILCQEQEE